MGISGFFNELNKEYNITKKISENHKIKCRYLILDFNAIIHNITQYVIEHINSLLKQYLSNFNIDTNINNNILINLDIEEEFKTFVAKDEDSIYKFFNILFTNEKITQIIYNQIQKYILYVVNNCCHKEYIQIIYVCIDGVPSKAKIITQRKRSYIGTFISNF